MDRFERAFRAMDASSQEVFRMNLELYRRTGERKYAEEVLGILRNFDDDADVQAVINELQR